MNNDEDRKKQWQERDIKKDAYLISTDITKEGKPVVYFHNPEVEDAISYIPIVPTSNSEINSLYKNVTAGGIQEFAEGNKGTGRVMMASRLFGPHLAGIKNKIDSGQMTKIKGLDLHGNVPNIFIHRSKNPETGEFEYRFYKSNDTNDPITVGNKQLKANSLDELKVYLGSIYSKYGSNEQLSNFLKPFF
jgi:hypothetical protein